MQRRQEDHHHPSEETESDDERHIRRTGRRSVFGGAIGLIAGLAIGLLAGIINFDARGPVAACALAGAIAGLAIGSFTGGMSGLESPAPGNEPSETSRPLREVPELNSDEGEGNEEG